MSIAPSAASPPLFHQGPGAMMAKEIAASPAPTLAITAMISTGAAYGSGGWPSFSLIQAANSWSASVQ